MSKRPPAGQQDLLSLRLPVEMIDAVKTVAASRHLPVQALIRSRIGERLDAEHVETATPSNTNGWTIAGLEVGRRPGGHSTSRAHRRGLPPTAVPYPKPCPDPLTRTDVLI